MATSETNDVVEVTDDTFEQEVVERSKEKPVVVDFWADWCGPCHALTPVLESAVAGRGDVVLAKVDVDANQEVARRFDVRGIPAVKGFRNGNVVAEFVGAVPRAKVAEFLDELTKAPLVDSLQDDEELASPLREGDYERAFDILLERVRHHNRRDQARALMIELFAELGRDDPLTEQYRRKLATELF